jgi:hypothetical protein
MNSQRRASLHISASSAHNFKWPASQRAVDTVAMRSPSSKGRLIVDHLHKAQYVVN